MGQYAEKSFSIEVSALAFDRDTPADRDEVIVQAASHEMTMTRPSESIPV